MRYGWIILLVSGILGLLVALLLTLSPNTVLVEPAFRAGNVPGALRAWGVTWLFFNVIALVVLFRGFRQGERWAWWTLWLLPALWLCLFFLDTSLIGLLTLTLISVTGLLLSLRRFFPKEERHRGRSDPALPKGLL